MVEVEVVPDLQEFLGFWEAEVRLDYFLENWGSLGEAA